MWGWGYRRPSGGEALIALLIMLLINVIALPIMGIAGIMSEKEDEKVKGFFMLVIGIIIWGYVLLNMGK